MESKYALQNVMVKNSVPLAEAEKHYKSITKKKPRKVRETEGWWRFRYMPPTRFEKDSFRTKVVNDDIHLTFGKLKKEHERLEGRGLFDYFTKAYDYVANKARSVFDYVKDAVSITNFSQKTLNLLEVYGDNTIVKMVIRRVPLNFGIDLALQGVSAGKWEQLKEKYGFDKFFHLSLIVYLKGANEITLNTGKKRRVPKVLQVEKLEVVSVNENVGFVEGQEELDVPLTGKPFTLRQMLQNTRDRMGDTRFFSYSALGDNNCQNFVKELLLSQGLYRKPEADFTFQDLSELVKELPESTKTISQGITHIGALANKYFGIGGAKNEIIIPKEEFVKEHKHLIGLLRTSDDPALQKEADIQAKELKSKGGKKPCWKGYEQIGMKEKDGKSVPNCVPTGGAKLGLNDLISENKQMDGGTKQSGFIRAMMARDKAKGEDDKELLTEYKDINKEKFKYLDKEGFKLRKLTKTTHDLAEKKKQLTKNEAIQSFHNYVVANAEPFEPKKIGKVRYYDTFDLDDMWEKWKETQGVEVREARRAKREAVVEEPDSFFPPGMFDLPKPPVRKRPPIGKPIVVPVEDVPKVEKVEDEKEEPKAVLGKFESPRTKFEKEINSLVDYAVSHLHFNDVITEVLNPKKSWEYTDTHSGATKIAEAIMMYYYITQYKLPIIYTGGAGKIQLTKDIATVAPKSISYRNFKELQQIEESIYGKNKEERVPTFNVTPNVSKMTKPYQKELISELKLHLDNGEKQILLFMGIGIKGKGFHSNLLIFRAVEKKLYNIDPHGEGRIKAFEAQYKKVDTVCTALAKGVGFTYITSGQSCPYLRGERKLGFQAIECMTGHKTGFCAWWNAFVVELCCLKPDTPFDVIYKESSELLSAEPEKLYRAIIHYQYKLQQVILQIAEKAGIDVAKRGDIENVYDRLAVVVFTRLKMLKEKRKEILGYAKPD